MSHRFSSEQIEVTDSVEAVSDLFFKKGWTDGLPIIPPTQDAVYRMLAGTNRSATDVVSTIPPLRNEATVESLAINAVMAGCLPEYLPILIAAITAMCEEPFNLNTMQTTTHPCCPLTIINGPIVKNLNINGKFGAFGSGWRSNATIGRAINLILMNIGGAFPGKTDMSTQSQPSKYAFCIAENEEDSPWEPLHVERGFAASTSTVTVAIAENPHNINDHHAMKAEEMLTTIAGTMTTLGSNDIQLRHGNPILALSPEHAATIAKDGFSKKDVKAYLYEKARVSRRRFHERMSKAFYSTLEEDALIPMTAAKEDLVVIVVGGPGKHSSFLPSFGRGISITKDIQ